MASTKRVKHKKTFFEILVNLFRIKQKSFIKKSTYRRFLGVGILHWRKGDNVSFTG